MWLGSCAMIVMQCTADLAEEKPRLPARLPPRRMSLHVAELAVPFLTCGTYTGPGESWRTPPPPPPPPILLYLCTTRLFLVRGPNALLART